MQSERQLGDTAVLSMTGSAEARAALVIVPVLVDVLFFGGLEL